MTFDAKFALIMIVFSFLEKNLPQSADPPLSLSITAVEQTIPIGSEAKVRTTLTNITSHPVTFSDTNPDCDYLADMRDDKGDFVLVTDYKRQLKCYGGLSDARNILVTLKPHESRNDEILLTRLFVLNHAGRYSVFVKRKLPKVLDGGTVKSNTITITVTD